MTAKKHLEFLFDSNPPSSPVFVRDLFHNREDDLFHGGDLLKNGQDFDKILAVHGETQVGKSHLVQRLLLDVKLWGPHYIVFQVNANNRGTVDAILEEILHSLRKEIERFDGNKLPDGAQEIYHGARSYFQKIEPILSHQAHEITFSITQEELATFSADARLTLLAPFANFYMGSGAQSQTKNGESMSMKLSKLLPTDLINLIQYTADVLRALYPNKKVLLFVDDLDLLDRLGGVGKEESHKLADHLRHLASMEAIVVLTTIRHAYFNGRQKDFKNFIRVKSMESEGLLEVYQRHINTYNSGEPVFAPEALDWLARGTEGKVGIFLSRLYEIWRENRNPKSKMLGLNEAKKFVREHIKELLRTSKNVKTISQITQAVLSQQLEVKILEDLSDSELLNRVLHPQSATPNQYTIDSIYVDVIKETHKEPS
jgi:hypothetical protein